MVDERPMLEGRTLYVPRMCYGTGRTLVASFRAVGIDARLCPEADEQAAEVALTYLSGDECYPQRVTLAQFLMVTRETSFDPGRAALAMPTTTGPCRFGQYAPLFERTLRKMGCAEARIVAPTSDTGYRDLGEHATGLRRLAWWGLVASDLLRRVLHTTRPYERIPGAADRTYRECLDLLCSALEHPPAAGLQKLKKIVEALTRCRERFELVPVQRSRERLLVGVVGEIFCRLSTYSNEDLVRRVEALGGEVWLSGVTEWVHYVNAWEKADLQLLGRTLSRTMLESWVSGAIQHRDERKLTAPFRGWFVGREEPHSVHEILELARPYLPWEGAMGEMVLSVGKAVYLQRKGAHAVVDISPFGCMNGVVSEAVYPLVSRDNGGIPIRSFYFDGTATRLETDLEIFLELAETYRRTGSRGEASAPRPPNHDAALRSAIRGP